MRPEDSLRRQMIAIGLTAATVLLFEIAITRVLSVVLWYHWAFLSVSLAMVGLGAPGVWFSFRTPTRRLRDGLLIAGGALVPVAVACVISISPTMGSSQVLFCMASLLVPFLCLGAGTCILLLQAPAERIGPVYAADLLGASLAALLVIPAMDRLPTPALTAGFGILPLLAAWVLGANRKAIAAGAVIIVALVAWGSPLQVTRNKSYDEAEHAPFLEKWTATARLTFFDRMFFADDDQQAFTWGLGANADRTRERDQYWMEQDGSAGTPVTRFGGDLDDVAFLLDDVTTVAYQVFEPDSVAVIGAGGGRDVLSALVAGANTVDAVELNPHVIEIVSGPLGDFSGDPYHRPGVRAFASEGRAFLTRTERRYDMIQISMIDSWAATAAGAFSLSENNLYTKEAYRLYWSRLSDRGVISTSRWSQGRAVLELPRLAVLVAESLREAGVENPQRHIAIAGAGRVATLIASKQPFEGPLRLRLLKTCRDRGFDVLYFPRAARDLGPKRELYRAVEDGPSWWSDQGLDLSAPTDDRPFFFQVVPPLAPIDRELADEHGFNAEAVVVLQLLMLVLLLLTIVLFFAPFVLVRWMPKGPGRWRGSGYFAAIGLGFMLIEVPWLQRFILFLGHPSLAATVVLGTMLLGTGIGSMLSNRVGTARLRRWGLLVPLVLGAVNVGLAGLFEASLGLPFAGRVAVAATLLVPVGVGLGLFFPLGMLAFGDRHKAWFWAINGASGVLASVVSLAAAMAFGFTAVAWAGVGAYAVAWGLLRLSPAR